MCSAGRPEKPLGPAAAQLTALAEELRQLRRRSGLTYRELAKKTELALSTVNAASSGQSLPSWRVTQALTHACAGDEEEVRGLWEAAAKAAGRAVPAAVSPQSGPPDPTTALTPKDFLRLMSQLRTWAGNPSLAILNERSKGWLPPSTVSQAMRRDKLPRLDLVTAYVAACGLEDDQVARWQAAWSAVKSPEANTGQDATDQRESNDGLQPAPASSKMAKALRRLAVIDEKILDGVPQERLRYTLLGVLMVNSATPPAFGFLAILLVTVPPPWRFFLAPCAVLWGAADFWLNRWMIGAVRDATSLLPRLGVLAARMALAAITSLIIAESLLLGVFRTEVAQQIQVNRTNDISRYEYMLRDCNPVKPPAAIEHKCVNYVLPFETQAYMRTGPGLSDLTLQRSNLNAQIKDSKQRVADAKSLARRECIGVSGVNLTGKGGEGPKCRRLKIEADRASVDADIPKLQGTLIDLDKRIAELERENKINKSKTKDEIDTVISQKVAEKRAHQHDAAGLSELISALGDLAEKSFPVAIGQSLFRVLLVMISILPSFIFWLLGNTTYEELLARQKVIVHQAAIEDQRRAKAEKDFDEMVGQITDLTEKLPQILSSTTAPDIGRLLAPIIALQERIAELTRNNSRMPDR